MVISNCVFTIPKKTSSKGRKTLNQKPSKKGSKAKSRSKRVMNKSSNILGGLSSCSKHLLLAYAKPFHAAAHGVCTPSFPARITQRTTALKYGTFASGLNKRGWILISPTGANDLPFLYTSTSASPGYYALCANSTSASVAQLPYSSTQLWGNPTESQVPSVRCRIVCVGLRVRCISPKMWVSGRLYAYMSPQHQNVNGYNIDMLGDKRETLRFPVTSDWIEFPIVPVDSREFEFPDSSIPASTGQAYSRAANSYLFPWSNAQTWVDPPDSADYAETGIPCFVLMVAAPDTAEVPSLEFEYELIVHAEYIGVPCDSVAIPAHSDAQGLSEVNAAANSSYIERAGTTDHTQEPSMLESFVKNIEANSNRMTTIMGSVTRVLGAGTAAYAATRGMRRLQNI